MEELVQIPAAGLKLHETNSAKFTSPERLRDLQFFRAWLALRADEKMEATSKCKHKIACYNGSAQPQS